MTKMENRPDKSAKLRKKAEEKLRQKMPRLQQEFRDLSIGETDQLIHELEVHQIELEFQNNELRAAQEELEVSRKLYFDLYDLAPVGYCVISEKGMILKANLTAATLLGKPRSHLINYPISQFIIKKDQNDYYRHRKLLFETGQPQIFELQMVGSDNRPFWVRLDTTLADHDGKTPICNVVLIDINETKRAETSLKEKIKEKTFFQALSDILQKPGICLDEVLQEAVNLIPPAWLFPEITVACIELETKVFRTNYFRETPLIQTSEITVQGKVIGHLTVCCLETPPAYTDEQLMGEKSRLLNDIAVRLGQVIAQIRMAEEVQRSEEFLRSVINSITNPFAVINVSDYSIEIANTAYGGQEAIGKKCHEYSFHWDIPCKGVEFLCPVFEVKRTGKPFKTEHEYYPEKGRKSYIEIYAYPVFDRNRQVVQVIKYLMDTTERKQTERELSRKADQLKDMNTALKVLLKKREQDKADIEEKIFANFQLTLSPVLADLKKMLTQDNQLDMIDILESDLNNILSPFSKKLSDKMIRLTPTEIHIADLIKIGKINKEIAALLNCSPNTVSRHRDSIRKKTGLKNRKINLRTFLLSLQ